METRTVHKVAPSTGIPSIIIAAIDIITKCSIDSGSFDNGGALAKVMVDK